MEVPEKIRLAAERLKDGHRVNRITVRDFLRHFGAERRGAVKVEAISDILSQLNLRTDPDFATAWIDAPLWLLLKDDIVSPAPEVMPHPPLSDDSQQSSDMGDLVLESTPSVIEQIEQQIDSAPTSAIPDMSTNSGIPENGPIDDPTFRIGSLPAANKKLIVVGQNDPLMKAVTLMLQHDFAQLPVMQGDREVKGVVTWKSIASKKVFECKCESVGDCREEPRIVDSNRTLFDAIPTIVEHGYVLVRDQRDKKITGIVTASDLSLQFQALAEPFLLLREIELHVRQILGNKLSMDDLQALDGAPPKAKNTANVADLTFGQYVRLFQHPGVWAKLGLKIDAGVLTSLLEEVRIIRNDVMHFDPDPMTAEELGTLKRASNFMQSLFELLP